MRIPQSEDYPGAPAATTEATTAYQIVTMSSDPSVFVMNQPSLASVNQHRNLRYIMQPPNTKLLYSYTGTSDTAENTLHWNDAIWHSFADTTT